MTAAMPGREGLLVDLGDGLGIHGHVDRAFLPVLDEFVANFRSRLDGGSGCTIHVDGEVVVDLWGGVADARSGRPWAHDTAAVIFSCSKGLLAVCAYVLVQRGELDLDAPIARYWPEFAANGKAEITVRDALGHRAGLASLDRDLTRSDVVAWSPVIAAIEAQTPSSTPGMGHTYHAMTHGWLIGEIIRRITGMTPGRWFEREIADRFGLQTWIGLPVGSDADVAWMAAPLPDEDSEIARRSGQVAADDPTVERSVTLGGAFAFPADGDHVTFNASDLRAAEIPAANGISTTGALARLYSECVFPATGTSLLDVASIRDALHELSSGTQLTGMPDDGARWGTGFQLASPPSQPMLGPTSFGHAGAGGQLAFGDLDRRVGFAYLSSQMGGYGDQRARALTLALASCL